MINVFYDGQCHICAREIAYYRRIAPDGIFIWHNVLDSKDTLKQLGVTTVQALEILHVQDQNGKLHLGVDAFILIWSQLKYWRILAKVGSLPLIYTLASWLYQHFAKRRFKRLQHCQVALKEEQQEDQS
tara:strand:- start:821 stop:1207 length:387 start_codon:yes stop_codon:yes gene_type:complete